MQETEALEQLSLQIKDFARELTKGVAAGRETPRLAVLRLREYGRGVIDAAVLIYDSARALDDIAYVLDSEMTKIDPDWLEYDREYGKRRPVDVVPLNTTDEHA